MKRVSKTLREDNENTPGGIFWRALGEPPWRPFERTSGLSRKTLGETFV